MKLDSAHITNFKLLEDIKLDFSTDPAKPLTVIRAENGSGKTSILQALRWAMWGERGIPTQMRLTSTAKPTGQPVTVQASVEFTETDSYSSEVTRYRLIRTCVETPGEGDKYTRPRSREKLFRLTERGDEEIREGKEGLISAVLPLTLAHVFFTDGDAVQRFISAGEQSSQEYVHQAIRQILGLDDVELAQNRLQFVNRKFRQELTSSGSIGLKQAEEEFERVEDEIKEEQREREVILERIANVEGQIRDDERELDGIKGIGDLEEVQARIKRLEDDKENLESTENGVRKRIRDLFESESLSMQNLHSKLQLGISTLESLADRKVIPGISIGVLEDRLEIGRCICGIELADGDPRHSHITNLIKEQQTNEPWKDRLTEMLHEARRMQAATLPDDAGSIFSEQVASLKQELIECREQQRQKESDLRAERDRREQIDEERVQQLTQRLNSNRAKKDGFERKRGQVDGRIQELEGQSERLRKRVEDAERQETLSATLKLRSIVTEDLVTLTTGTLNRLKLNYVQQVSERMNELFLEIVGADTTAETNLFSGVHIAENYDIVIRTQEGRTLDANTELNGASQRALTLSLIWALMEVAGREAPRIIDTPLGMTSGAVKHRMVELLTAPADSANFSYQVILFMTRSEIRDIEQLIADRSGAITTLTCSKDYPRDLSNDWGDRFPTVRACECNHTEYCQLCQRRHDANRLTCREISISA